MTYYRLTDAAAEQVRQLIVGLGEIDANLTTQINDGEKPVLFKRTPKNPDFLGSDNVFSRASASQSLPNGNNRGALNESGENESGEINYEGLQFWLEKQPTKRNFDSEYLRILLNPIRRLENRGIKRKGIEYLESLIEAVNGLREDSSQK